MGWFHAAYAAGELGGFEDGGTCALPPRKVQVPPCPKSLTGVEVIYHMCEKADWEEAVNDKIAYFPPTFHKDGKFTRASAFKEGLMDVANHFYKATSDAHVEWICLQINLKLLLDMGIVVLPQPEEEDNEGAALSASSQEQDGKEEKKDTSDPVQCFQVYAGISTIIPGLITNIYPIKRGGCGTFLTLEDPLPYHPPHLQQEQQKKKQSKPKQSNGDSTKQPQSTTRIPGVGSVPNAESKKEDVNHETKKSEAKPEQPAADNTASTKKSSKSKGIGKMFGMGSKK